MPIVRLAKIFKDIKVHSASELFLKTKSTEKSLLRQAQTAAITDYYLRNGSFKGYLGLPVGSTKYVNNTASRDFAGASIKFTDNGPGGGEQFTAVQVRFTGFHCTDESDEWSGSDEPYFIIGVAGSNGSNTVIFGPYGKINKGSKKFELTEIVGAKHGITPPIVLGVVVMENDQGTPKEAEEKVRQIFLKIESAFDSAVSTFTGTDADSHVLPQWSRDILIGWAPELISGLFGMGDDVVGKVPVLLFDLNAQSNKWVAPPVKGKHGPNNYNLDVVVDGGDDEGAYTCYFDVQLLTLTSPKPQQF